MTRDLNPRIVYGDIDLTTAPFMWEFGGKLGSAELVLQTLQQQLQDGEIVTSERASNRTLELTVLIGADDLGALALAEADLALEASKPRNTLTFDPGDDIAPATVFDTFTASLSFDRDDEYEQNGVRRYTLSIPALPYPRSKDQVAVSVPAPTGTAVNTMVDAGGSTTGWTSSGSGASSPALSGTHVETHTSSAVSFSLKRSGLSVSMATTPYLRLRAGVDAVRTDRYLLNGSEVALLASGGEYLWVDASGVGTLNTVEITGVASQPFARPSTIWVAEIVATNRTTFGSGGYQNSRLLDVEGSARAQVGLELAGGPTTLGSALVYTTPDLDAFQPPLSPWMPTRTGLTPSSSLISGGFSDATVSAFIPAASIPAGGYLLLARVRDTLGTGDYPISAKALITPGPGITDDPGVTVDHTVHLASGDWTIVTLGMFALPPTRVWGSWWKVSIEIVADTLQLDEAWLFNLDRGRLTWVDVDRNPLYGGYASSRLWIDPASVDDPKPSIWRGTQGDRSDSQHAGPGAQAWGVHEFAPPKMQVFTVTTDSADTDLNVTYYPRWNTHAAL